MGTASEYRNKSQREPGAQVNGGGKCVIRNLTGAVNEHHSHRNDGYAQMISYTVHKWGLKKVVPVYVLQKYPSGIGRSER